MILSVKVSPHASCNVIKRYENGILYVDVAACPEKGEANEALVRFLAKTLKLEAQAIKIVSGKTARLKKLKLPLDEKALPNALRGVSSRSASR